MNADLPVIHMDALRAQFKASLAVQFQYRAAQVIWLLFFVLQPTMYLSIWSTVAHSTGGQVGGYAPRELAAYFLVSMWVIHLTFNGVLVFFEGRVRRGEFSPLLLRPIHPIFADIADNLAYKALTVPLLGLATFGLVTGFQPLLDPPGWALAAFAPALLLAFVVRFLNGWMLALSAFWLTRTQALIQAYLLLLLFLGGQAMPLSLLPDWVQTVAWLSPFRWILAFPTELLIGRLTPAETLAGFGMQLLWAVASLLLLRLCWRAAVRRYSAVGS
ncbi:MAG: ABC-2 family transporter protein [Chloroflexota bacterium]|nr:ABC-2 family transporter protein [Chloroflexota bacterium]